VGAGGYPGGGVLWCLAGCRTNGFSIPDAERSEIAKKAVQARIAKHKQQSRQKGETQ